MTERIIEVPKEAEGDVDLIVEGIRDALNETGMHSEHLSVARPSGRNMLPGDVSSTVMLVASGSLAWLTKKWVDTYVWPRIQKRVHVPSERLLAWLFNEKNEP
jgi:hypothetical protein